MVVYTDLKRKYVTGDFKWGAFLLDVDCWYTIPKIYYEFLLTNIFTSIAGEGELTGATNLMAHYGLEHSYSKFSGKKVKEQLSSFLPNLPGVIDGPGHLVSNYFFVRESDFSSLQVIIILCLKKLSIYN